MTKTQITPLGVLRENMPELAEWIKSICRYNAKFEDFIVADYKESRLSLSFYTKNYKYSLSARLPNPDDNGYLGAMVDTRKPRAGEDWNRGNDLADGKYCKETWDRIVADIVSYEIVKVVKPKKGMVNFLSEGGVPQVADPDSATSYNK